MLSATPWSLTDDVTGSLADAPAETEYRLQAEELKPLTSASVGDTTATAMEIVFNGGDVFEMISDIGSGPHGSKDVDMYKLVVSAADVTNGKTYIFLTSLPLGGKSFDTYIRLFNSGGTEQAWNDDGGEGNYSKLTFKPTVAGSYYLVVFGYGNHNMTTGTSPYIFSNSGTGNGGAIGDYALTVTRTEYNASEQDIVDKLKTIGLNVTNESYVKWDIVGGELRLVHLDIRGLDPTDIDSLGLDWSVCTSLETMRCYNSTSESSVLPDSLFHAGDLSLVRELGAESGAAWGIVDGKFRLTHLNISYWGLFGTLNLSSFSALQNLYCSGNQLTALDVSGCSNLKHLEC